MPPPPPSRSVRTDLGSPPFQEKTKRQNVKSARYLAALELLKKNTNRAISKVQIVVHLWSKNALNITVKTLKSKVNCNNCGFFIPSNLKITH